jgi:hypothetical protein
MLEENEKQSSGYALREVRNASSNNIHTLVWRHNRVEHPRGELKMENKRKIIF